MTYQERILDAVGNVLEIRERVEQPLPPDPVPEKVTETQFMRAAVKVGIVTAAEAKAYLARGVIPAFVETAVAQIPANVRTDAELKIIGSDTFHRTDPVFAMLIAGGAATSEQVDDLFRLAATLD
jgi:hypothetical protein